MRENIYGPRIKRTLRRNKMIFHDFFNKNFHFKISSWCSGLPEKLCLTVIVLYCCLNRFGPLCFSNLTMQLTIASWGAFLLVGAFLYFSKYKISDICSFRYIVDIIQCLLIPCKSGKFIHIASRLKTKTFEQFKTSILI